MPANVDMDKVSFVISSQYREEVLEALEEQPATPSELANVTPFDVAHVSRALQELRKNEVVELLVSEDRKKGRIYGVSDTGEEVARYVAERQ